MDPVRPGIGLTALVTPGSPPSGAPENAQPLAPALTAQLEQVVQLWRGKKFVLLTGAGLSTDSGIPDYRGPTSVPRNPLTYQEFVGDAQLRQRYWARNHMGWQFMRQAVPNGGHFAATVLEGYGLLSGIITQNVDRLHEDAGAVNVVDLHGRFDRVACLQCGTTFSRIFVATLLSDANPEFLDAVARAGGVSMGPDADSDLDHEVLIASFNVPACPVCNGMLKPDFVFFGENVPKDRVERSFAMVEEAAGIVVAGSSLTVMSGLRFVKKAAKDGKHVIIINRGATRGDELANVKIEAGVSEAMTHVTYALRPRLAQPPKHRVQ
ncbi:Sir2 family NAD-dependent protein deacetylase [Arthrobacter glacialis]|uniref:protein acetyllysine N-acetyltransferase n=1 Tax=Arthrobacter glacialis TaxID=1664 RepID=A0A2S3ZW72_ARTGL|nr:Sir2 family NAD-dependent protein deacetylase [Arthrobacter glacialis]POH73511.1 NAD-dependent deacetylase [Arthrobacter glacialis]